MRVATIDIGTNSVLLLIAESSADSVPIAVCERCTITRLGKGVDRSRALDPAAVERTLACLREYAALIDNHGAVQRAAVATSAVRDAAGASDFVRRAASVLGTAPRVIDGPTEARLTFAGSLSGLAQRGGVCVFDIGGGSTEIVHGIVAANEPPCFVEGVSLDIGAVRLTERHVHDDPPAIGELDAVRQAARTALLRSPRPSAGAGLVGIAGTVTTLSAIELGLERYDGKRVHGRRLTREAIGRIVAKLSSMQLPERRLVVGLEPARADVMIAGALIVDELLAWAGAEFATVSDRGVRWGLALELLGTR